MLEEVVPMKKTNLLIGALVIAIILGTIKDIFALAIILIVLRKNTQSK